MALNLALYPIFRQPQSASSTTSLQIPELAHFFQLTMPPLSTHSRTLLRIRSRQHIPVPITQCLFQQQRRTKASAVEERTGEYDKTPQFDSPFRSRDNNPTTKIPSFANYMSKKGETSNKTFQYFMVGAMGLLTAAGAKATVQGESSCTNDSAHKIRLRHHKNTNFPKLAGGESNEWLTKRD